MSKLENMKILQLIFGRKFVLQNEIYSDGKRSSYWPANVIGLAEGELDKIAVTTKDKEHF